MAIKKEIWDKAKAFYEAGKSINWIAKELGISKSTLSGKAKKEEWEQGIIEQLKDDIKGVEEQNRTISEQNRTIIEQVSTLDQFQIEVIRELIEDETKQKSLILNGLNMGVIRATQQLQNNKKQQAIKVRQGYGKGDYTESIENHELELSSQDIKNNVDTIKTVGISLGIIEDKPNSQVTVNTQNNMQQNQHTELNKQIVSETLEAFEDEY